MSWAHVALENGQGKYIYNYNLGNIGVGKLQPYYKVAGSKFRAFSSFEEGGKAYWTHLKNKCQAALSNFDWADISKVIIHLKKCGYYEVSSEHYQKLMNSLFWQAHTKIIPQLESN